MSTKAFKSDKIAQIKEKVEKAQVAIVTEYKGMSVEEITKLRRALQKEDGDYMVTKNTLAKIAFKGTDFEKMEIDRITEADIEDFIRYYHLEDKVNSIKKTIKLKLKTV